MASTAINTLWLPEKPAVAREIVAALKRTKGARVLNQATAPKDGIYHLSSKDSVTCCFSGHALSMLPPSRYITREQASSIMDHLPLIPDEFLFEPKPETGKDGKVRVDKDGKPVPSKRFEKLKKWVLSAKKIVNACDIDREGQLIFDEILRYCGRDPYANDVSRAMIVSMTEEALDQTVSCLEPNGAAQWRNRGDSAQTRQKMDWLLGMNASMAYQVITGVRNMSAGRVQTPVLAIVVLRDLAIEKFKPQTYYVPTVTLPGGVRLRWESRHGAENEPGFDPNGRIIDLAVAQGIIGKIQAGLAGTVSAAKVEDKSTAPPLPFSMGSLQSAAAKEHGLSVKEVTEAAQTLYEKLKAITYVGTDCRYLPEDMHPQSPEVLSSLSERFRAEIAGSNPALKSKAFSNEKMGDSEHFAIIPSGNTTRLDSANHAELCVFSTIAKRYIAQFYPAYRYQTATASVMFDRDEFRASSKRVVDLGWKAAEGAAEDEEDAEGEGDGRGARPARPAGKS